MDRDHEMPLKALPQNLCSFSFFLVSVFIEMGVTHDMVHYAGHRASLGIGSCLLPYLEARSLVLLCIYQDACPLTVEELGVLMSLFYLLGLKAHITTCWVWPSLSSAT